MTTKSEARKLLEKLNKGPITFGQLVESHRLCDDSSQAELARRMEISRAHLCDYRERAPAGQCRAGCQVRPGAGLSRQRLRYGSIRRSAEKGWVENACDYRCRLRVEFTIQSLEQKFVPPQGCIGIRSDRVERFDSEGKSILSPVYSAATQISAPLA